MANDAASSSVASSHQGLQRWTPTSESAQESGEGKDESIVERMEQAAQRPRQESGQLTDDSQADQQQDMPASPSTDV